MPSKASIPSICEQCEKPFLARPDLVKIGRGRFCSQDCFHEYRRQTRMGRFWEQVDKSGDCWLWTGSTRTGYGHVCIDGRKITTHRLVWELTHGDIPDGMDVCHKCDNRPCCNLDHLFLGTHAENMADMAAKGRAPRGENSGKAKLTDEDVRVIRSRVAAGESQRAMAREYGIGKSTVWSIVARVNWKHLD